MSNLSLHRHVAHSNLPSHVKSNLRAWYDGAMSKHGGALSRAKIHAVESAHAVRQGGESIVTGAALGAIEQSLAGGLDYKRIPIDGALAVAGLVGGVMLAHENVGADLRNVGAAGAAIFSYRKMGQAVAARRNSVAHGESDVGVDTILEAAKRL